MNSQTRSLPSREDLRRGPRSRPVAPLSAQTATPKDPKSPVPGFADGRGPTGPVTLKIVSPKPDEVIPIPPAAAGQPPAKGAPVAVKVELANYELFQDDGDEERAVRRHPPRQLLRDFAYRDATKPCASRAFRRARTRCALPDAPVGRVHQGAPAFAIVTFHVGEKDGKNTAEPGRPFSRSSPRAARSRARRDASCSTSSSRAAWSPTRPCPTPAASATRSTRRRKSRSRRTTPSGSRTSRPGGTRTSSGSRGTGRSSRAR